MDDEMINRVAEAMWKENKWHSDFKLIDEHHTLYPKKKEFINQAKAAFKAMREPTDKMVDAGESTFSPPDFASAALAYQTMIDCILND